MLANRYAAGPCGSLGTPSLTATSFTVKRMTKESTSMPLASREERLPKAPAVVAERARAAECRYDAKDPTAVFRAKAEARLPGRRGPQKRPTKVAVTLRYSREVLEYFKATGEGWQTRMNEALRDYVERHRTA